MSDVIQLRLLESECLFFSCGFADRVVLIVTLQGREASTPILLNDELSANNDNDN